jgi:hypothetical protein
MACSGTALLYLYLLSPLPGIEPRSPGRPAHSQTPYWLSYPAHFSNTRIKYVYVPYISCNNNKIWNVFKVAYKKKLPLDQYSEVWSSAYRVLFEASRRWVCSSCDVMWACDYYPTYKNAIDIGTQDYVASLVAELHISSSPNHIILITHDL